MLKPFFLKKATKKPWIFKKLEYRFSFENTGIENAAFPSKTVLSKANVKTNRIRSTKWTYEREMGFAPDYFIFSKVLFSHKSLL